MTQDSYSKLDARIDAREQDESKRGLLTEGLYTLTHLYSRSDEQSLEDLRELRARATSGDNNFDVDKALDRDDRATDWRREVANYSSGFLKVVPLFIGKWGYPLSAAVNGADEVRKDSSLVRQAVDFTLGATKGVALKWSLDRAGTSDLNVLSKGLMLGASNGFVQSGLSSRNWYDDKSASWQLGNGIAQTTESTVFGAGVGALAFPIGAQLSKVTGSLTERLSTSSAPSTFLTSMSTGFSFGLTSGSTSEAARELRNNEPLSPTRILFRGLAEGAVSTLAAGAGIQLSELSSELSISASQRPTTEAVTALVARGQRTETSFSTEPERVQWLTQQPSRILDVALRLANGAEVPEELLQTIKNNPELAKSITNEQTRAFLDDAMVSQDATKGLDFLIYSGAMAHIIPELAELIGPNSAQDPKFHPEGNVWEHTKLVMQEQANKTKDLPIEQRRQEMLATLLHDVSKPETQKIWPDGGISNHQHAEKGAVKSTAILERLGYGDQTQDLVTNVIKDHMRMHTLMKMDPKGLNTILGRPYIEAKIRLQASDALGRLYAHREDNNLENFLTDRLQQFRAERDATKAAADAAKAAAEPRLLTGHDLIAAGVEKGPRVGEILAAVASANLSTRAQVTDWLQLHHKITLKASETPNE